MQHNFIPEGPRRIKYSKCSKHEEVPPQILAIATHLITFLVCTQFTVPAECGPMKKIPACSNLLSQCGLDHGRCKWKVNVTTQSAKQKAHRNMIKYKQNTNQKVLQSKTHEEMSNSLITFKEEEINILEC